MEETNVWKKTFEKLRVDIQKNRENIEVLQSKLDFSKCLFE